MLISYRYLSVEVTVECTGGVGVTVKVRVSVKVKDI